MAILLLFGPTSTEKFGELPSHLYIRAHPRPRYEIPSSMVFSRYAMQFVVEGRANETSRSNFSGKISMPDPNLPLLEDAVHKLAPFLEEIVFVGGITLGLLITDKAAAPIRGTNDVDVIAEIRSEE